MSWPKGKPKPQKGKTYEEIYGKEKAEEISRKLRDAKKGENNPNWKGDVYIHLDGYARAYAPDHPNAKWSRVLRSHLVVEEYIGRFLLSGEIVHHIDGDRLNDSPENLYLYSSVGEHVQAHMTNNLPTESNLEKGGEFNGNTLES